MLSLFLNVGNTVYCTCFFKTSRQFLCKNSSKPCISFAMPSANGNGWAFFAVPNGLHAQGFGLVQIVGAVVHHNALFGFDAQQAADVEIGLRIGFVEQAEVVRAEQAVKMRFQAQRLNQCANIKRGPLENTAFRPFRRPKTSSVPSIPSTFAKICLSG